MAIDYYPGGLRIGHMNEHVSGPRGSDPFEMESKFLVLILLNGRQVFTLNGERYELRAEEGSTAAAAVTIAVQTRATVHYLESVGAPLRKLAIACDLDWFSQFAGCAEDQLASLPQNVTPRPAEDVAARVWAPDARIARMATQIILPPPESSHQQLGLFRMSKGIEILRRMSEERNSAQHSQSCQKAEDVRLYILDHLSDDLSTGGLESQFGRNRRSLQRMFRAEYGIGIAEFVRAERLKRANNALQNDGISIAEAAFQAGYSNTANFSTAFRRAFGVPPAQVKRCAV